MEREKREERREIVVLYEGIDLDELVGLRGFCCAGTFSAFR